MKQCIKYLMIILLAASLHSGVLEAASELCTKNIDYTESAFQTQTTETTHLIHHLYDYLLSLPFCADYIGQNSVPGCKSVTLPINRIRPETTHKATFHKGWSAPNALSHSVDYYVYGLRKIVV